MFPLWRFFIEKRQFTFLLIGALTLGGVFSAITITKESAPEVQIPVGIVTTILPGASAEDIEGLITDKIEGQVANLQDLNKLTSTSREGVSTIVAEFNASADLEKSIQQLRDEVAKVKPELPSEAKDPVVSDVNFVDQPIQIISITADLPFARFAELGETLKDSLESIPGISRVEVSGVRDREIQIVVRKEDLARYGISLADVVGAVSASNTSLPVGSITLSGISYNIAFEGDLDTVEDIGDIAILNIQGQTIYLRDIATVSDGVEKATGYTRVSVGGEPSEQALTLNVFKVRGEDVTTVTAKVKKRLEELGTDVLAGSEVIITYDLGDQVNEDLGRLTRTGLETMVLVMISLLATIGWRESIVAGLSIPLSFLIAFIGLLYSGNTINFVSLFSLILAIGILVDSGIVVTEGIHTRILKLGHKREAAFETLHVYGWPLIAGTLTSVAVFVPLFFISGVVGKFIASIPFTVIFVLMASIFVALGLVPLIAMSFSKVDKGRLALAQEEYAEKARVWYAATLRRILDSRRFQGWFLLSMVVGFILAIALPITGLLKVNFFPGEDGDFVTIEMEMPYGTTLAETDLRVRAVEEELYGDRRFESIITTIGGTSAFSNAPQAGARFANITVNLVDPSLRKETSADIVEELRRKLALINTIEIRVSEPSGGPPVGAPILVKFSGRDRDALEAAVLTAERVLRETPGATEITTSTKNDGTEFVLSIDRGKLSELGLSPAAVASTLRTAVSGITATTLKEGSKETDVVVSLNLNPFALDPHEASFTTLDSIRQIPIRNSRGEVILLGSVLAERLDRSNAAISHENRSRLASISSEVVPGYNTLEVTAAFTAQMEKVSLPPGTTMQIGGENEETNKSFTEMFYAFIAGIFLMFVILVLAFNSFRFTTYLLLIVPLSLIGVFFGLALTGNPLSFPSLLGVIALAGVIINHAIILMDSIIVRLREHRDEAFRDVVVEAAVSRLRPIFLTTITTVIGMVPLTYASSLWGPLAFAIMFGLSFAMILTLILIPVLVYRWPGNISRFREQ